LLRDDEKAVFRNSGFLGKLRDPTFQYKIAQRQTLRNFFTFLEKEKTTGAR